MWGIIFSHWVNLKLPVVLPFHALLIVTIVRLEMNLVHNNHVWIWWNLMKTKHNEKNLNIQIEEIPRLNSNYGSKPVSS